jgi:hypothetical protein
MAMIIDIVQQPSVLDVVVTGDFHMEEAVDRFRQVVDACRLTGIRKVLIDYRQLWGGAVGTEKTFYSFGIDDRCKRHIRSGGKSLLFAFVGPDAAGPDPGAQFADFTKFPGRLFGSREGAVAWLNENAP